MGGKRKQSGPRRSRDDGDKRGPHGHHVALTHNEKLETFYRAQGFVADCEWSAFLGAMQQPLPACFRVHPKYTFAPTLDQQLRSYVGTKVALEDGSELEAVSELKWCPLGYKLGIDRKKLRTARDDNEDLAKLHTWLTTNTGAGHITRQEAVSMVPPLALNVLPHHKVLDMCASPGSKTSQLLEMISDSMYGPPEKQGLVVANDKDTSRAYMLVHQCRRSATPAMLVTTHSGQDFPTLNSSAILEFGAKPDVTSDLKVNAVGNYMGERNAQAEPFFDRTLCDVPCAGDGTIRKNQIVWKRWRVQDSIGLHPTQLAIARRGIAVTKPGGLIVYSTCSMSPYEDEAVVAELLRLHKGQLELVDARQFVPNFKARPGLSSWHVLDDLNLGGVDADGNMARLAPEVAAERAAEAEKDGRVPPVVPPPVGAPSSGDYLQDAVNLGYVHHKVFADVPERRRRVYKESVFAPSAEEQEWMHLERCMRCVPHDEDSGGFFVATLRKLEAPIVAADAEAEAAPAPATTANATATATATATAEVAAANTTAVEDGGGETEKEVAVVKTSNNKQYVTYEAISPELHARIADFFDFTGELAPAAKCLYVRHDKSQPESERLATGGMAAKIYYVPRAMGFSGCMQADAYKRLRIVQAGLSLLTLRKGVDKREDFEAKHQCEYRISQDAVAAVAPFMGQKRTARLGVEDFVTLLKGGIMPVTSLSTEVQDVVKGISLGAVVAAHDFSYLAPGAAAGAQPVVHTFYAVCWKNNPNFINVMVSKVELEEMAFTLRGLGVDIATDHVQGVVVKK